MCFTLLRVCRMEFVANRDDMKIKNFVGSSIDYAHDVGIPISIVMELTGGGWFGFDLPASEIDKNVKESAVGIFAMTEAVAVKYKI